MKTVKLKNLQIEDFIDCVKNFACFQIDNTGGELFRHEQSETADENCLLVDVQSANAVKLIYEHLKPENQAKINIILHDEYKLANFFDKMWGMIYPKRVG